MDSMLCQRLLLCRRKIIIFFYFDSDMVNFIDLFLFLLFIIILSKITIISLYISGWPGILWYIRLVLNRNLLTAYLKGTGIIATIPYSRVSVCLSLCGGYVHMNVGVKSRVVRFSWSCSSKGSEPLDVVGGK